MPGTTPPTSQLDWLSSTTAMIVLFWSRATRNLLKSFGWGIAALHSVRLQRRSCHVLAARPIGSFGGGSSRKQPSCSATSSVVFGDKTGDNTPPRLNGGRGMARPASNLHLQPKNRGWRARVLVPVELQAKL